MSENVSGLDSLSQQFMPDDQQKSSGDSTFKFIHDECLSCIKSSHDRYGDTPSQMLHDAIQKIDQLEQATDDAPLKRHVSNVKTALQELSMEGRPTLEKMVTAVELGLQDTASQAYTGGVQVQLSSMSAHEASKDNHDGDSPEDTSRSKKNRDTKAKEKPSLFEKFFKWLGK